MPIDVKNTGLVRGAPRPFYPEGADEDVGLGTGGEILIAQSLPDLAITALSGDSWQVRATTAAAPVAAIPTTAALIGLWNGEPANGKSYVIDSVFLVTVANTAAIQAMSILANVSKQAVLTALANTLTPLPLYANRTYGGKARVDVAITLDGTNGVAANWNPLGSSVAAQNTPQIGTTLDIDVRGKIIIPPGGQLALTCLAGAATASSVHLGIRWHEVRLPIPV